MHWSLLIDFFFTSSRSLLNISCIFSTLLSSLFICNSILFSRLWIICTIIILNSFSGRLTISFVCLFVCLFYHVSSHAEYFSAFSVCLDCCVWGALSVGGKVVIPLNSEVFSLWVELDQWLVKVFWLGELVSVFWWLGLNLLSGVQ